MLNKEGIRELAYVVLIDGIEPIPVIKIYFGYFILRVAAKKQIIPYGIAGKQ